MRALLVGLLLWQAAPDAQAPKPEPRHFLYTRTVTLQQNANGEGCVTLDAPVYAHAAPSLKDVRLFAGAREVPYALTVSEPVEGDLVPARVTDLGERDGRIVFNLEMPARPYTEVVLDLAAHDFVAGAEVSGTNRPGETPTRLGTYTVFDLGVRHLSRSTTLHLQEASFRTLHVELTMGAAPGSRRPSTGAEVVRGANVPPSREAQTLYTTVAEAASIMQQGKETVARFALPAHVPVERVSMVLQPEFAGNFSRDVVVTAHTAGDQENERLTGVVERVRLERAGIEVREEQLGFAATLGANLQADATVEVSIHNGDDPFLPLQAVRLEMRERRLCFPATSAGRLQMFYGDAALDAPRYNFARTFSPSAHDVRATLSAESLNPEYVARTPRERTVLERHPELLWVTLLAVVCVLAVVAIHSVRRLPR